MSLKHHYHHAAAEYLCNVYDFIGIGEGKELSALEVMHIKLRYPKLEQWYGALQVDGKRRVECYLLRRYGAKSAD
jgi:hypothetical protein